jgi:hypothetical protein
VDGGGRRGGRGKEKGSCGGGDGDDDDVKGMTKIAVQKNEYTNTTYNHNISGNTPRSIHHVKLFFNIYF